MPKVIKPFAFMSNSDYKYVIRQNVVYETTPHEHDIYEIVILLDGNFEHFICGKTIQMQKGDIIFIKPGEVHAFEPHKKTSPTVLTICINENYLNKACAFWGDQLKYYFSFNISGTVSLSKCDFESFLASFESFQTSRNSARDTLFNALTSILYTGLFKKIYKINSLGCDSHSFENILSDMNTPENIRNGMASFVKISSFSPRHIRRISKEKYNITPQQYITKLRMNYAQNLLLHSDMSILSIALEVGYASVTNFINQFKKAYKMTPSNFRKKFQNNELIYLFPSENNENSRTFPDKEIT